MPSQVDNARIEQEKEKKKSVFKKFGEKKLLFLRASEPERSAASSVRIKPSLNAHQRHIGPKWVSFNS